MISKSISVSEKVNSMSMFARLLYTWIIPHTDDFGRISGSPMKIKALVVPMAEESKTDVANALQEMVDQGLIVWYVVEGTQYIQINSFDKYQTGLHKRTKSRYPDPEEGQKIGVKTDDSEAFPEVPGSSGKLPKVPPEQNRTELNRTGTELNQQRTEGKPENDVSWLDKSDSNSDDMIQKIEHHFIQRRGLGIIPSASDIQSMQNLVDDGFTLEEIIQGIDHAFDHYKPKHKKDGIKRFAYCETVIRAENAKKSGEVKGYATRRELHGQYSTSSATDSKGESYYDQFDDLFAN